MKVLKKNVYWGTKSICTKYSSEIIGGSADCFIGGTEILDDDLEKNVLFIKVGNDDYREAKDLLEASKKLLPLVPKSAVLKIAMPKYDRSPRGVGDIFVKDLHRFFVADDTDKTKIDLEFAINESKTPFEQNTDWA